MMAAAAAAGVLTTRMPHRQVRTALAEVFGQDVADAPAARGFIEQVADTGLAAFSDEIRGYHYAASRPRLFGRSRSLVGDIADAFAKSSNVILAIETGVELEYYGPLDPYDQPCLNPLSAQWYG